MNTPAQIIEHLTTEYGPLTISHGIDGKFTASLKPSGYRITFDIQGRGASLFEALTSTALLARVSNIGTLPDHRTGCPDHPP